MKPRICELSKFLTGPAHGVRHHCVGAVGPDLALGMLPGALQDAYGSGHFGNEAATGFRSSSDTPRAIVLVACRGGSLLVEERPLCKPVATQHVERLRLEASPLVPDPRIRRNVGGTTNEWISTRRSATLRCSCRGLGPCNPLGVVTLTSPRWSRRRRERP